MALASLPSTRPPAPDDPDEQDEPGGRMSFLDHLDELRRRLVYSLLALLGGFLVCLLFIGRLFSFVMEPLTEALPQGGTLIFTEPTEAFLLQLKVAALAGLLVAIPIILYQVWMFVAPGLYPHERRLAIPFVAVASIFFVIGAAFSHFVVFPWAWQFFASFTTDYMTFMPRIAPAFGMYVKLMLAMGAVFQLPTAVLFLARIGLVTPGWMWKNFKYAVLVSFVFAAVLTPPDVVSQTLMAGPTILLYVLSIGIAWLFQKPRRE